MNTNAIKRYAPRARTAFIASMIKQAARYGITAKSIEPLEQKGDVALIGERALPASIARPRAALARRVEQQGFAQAMEQAAYSWFNRLCALRYMEIKGYLDHGRRVLSAADGSAGAPQILDECLDIELEGLDKARITELKLDGTKDEELYRELLLTQCHALHQAMPFLFEAVDDALELLLPDNLTKTDSLIRELVEAISEEDWQNVEIIGWLYQFYISEKKDQVIGKVVKSEDIPAATQLFTPNWIVQYLVQNSVGRLWLQTYPDSSLKSKEKMPYYIEPAGQTPEVQAQLAAITPESIDPLTIKVLDPACGSGHILVEAYKVLKAIYEERGFRSRDIPQLILEHNLFGLDIDDRAGQLAGFALMMLAREDDRRIFGREVKLNVLALQESRHLDFPALWKALNLGGDWQHGQSQNLFDHDQTDLGAAQADNRYQLLQSTLARFTQAKTFGSLIEVPAGDAEPLGELLEQLRQLAKDGDSMQKPAAQQLIPFVQQAWVLAQRYDAVVANPPYMGNKFYSPELKKWIHENYENAKGDLYAAFIHKNLRLAKKDSHVGMITIPNWMFLSSFESTRKEILDTSYVDTFIHNGRGVWGADFGSCSFVLRKNPNNVVKGRFKRLFDKQGSVSSNEDLASRFYDENDYYACSDDLKKIPGSPLAYNTPVQVLELFSKERNNSSFCEKRLGLCTGDNEKFLRFWHEVNYFQIGFDQGSYESFRETSSSYAPHNKGGSFRRWAGNRDVVIKFNNDAYADLAVSCNKLASRSYYFRECLTWTEISSGIFSMRSLPRGYTFNIKGPSVFYEEGDRDFLLGYFNSSAFSYLLGFINQTISFNGGDIERVPYIQPSQEVFFEVSDICRRIYEISDMDLGGQEDSWSFKLPILLSCSKKAGSIASYYAEYLDLSKSVTDEMRLLERENNKIFQNILGLQCINWLANEPPKEKISINLNPFFRYDTSEDDPAIDQRLQSDVLSELISYAIGCIMGRFSIDCEGLVYAHAGNQGFAELVREGTYKTFPADSDGILPLNDQEWFADDATNRFREFVRTVWGDKHLQENLDFVAESLCLYAIKPKRSESALDTIRRYLSTQFFKDHLKTYKKRPIYWLFSSGKHKAFECLVYLHRYHEGTLARMRTEYVIPLTAKLNTYANKLEQDIDASTSTAEKKRLEKELATLHNQQAELATFDEKLRHYADQRISLDLDDGVKVNYGKFGDLLAEMKVVTGDKE